MNFLDINLGLLTGVEQEFGFSPYTDLEKVKLRKNTRYRVLTMRDCIFGLIGSCNFTQNQKTAISRIYDEYSDKINILKQDKYISKSRLLILPTTSVPHAIKLYLLLDHALDFEVEMPKNYLDPVLVPVLFMRGLKYELHDFKGLLGKRKPLISKLLISVFKSISQNPDEYGAIHTMILKSLLYLDTFVLPERVVFGVFSYAYADYLSVNDSTVYYNRSDNNRKIAEKLIAKCKKIKVGSLKKEGVLNLKYLAESIAQDITIKGPEDILSTIECVLFSIENINPIELLTKDSAIDIQLFSNICAEYNLSAQYITLMSRKKELLDKSIYLAATYYSDEKEILTKALQLYYVMMTLQYTKEEHNRTIDRTLSELIRERESREEVITLRATLAGLQAKVAELTNELYNKQITTNVKDVNELHSDYYKMIKDLTRGLEEKDKEITRLKAIDTEEADPVPDKIEAPRDIDISDKNILFIGHFEAKETADGLRTYVKNLDFIDGTLKSNDLPADRMKKYDLLALQYQFLPHTTKKFIATARKIGLKVGRIEGTNLDKWVECVKDALTNK